MLAEALPDGVSYALAVVGLITAVLAIFPPFVGFTGLISRKPRDQIKDDVFMPRSRPSRSHFSAPWAVSLPCRGTMNDLQNNIARITAIAAVLCVSAVAAAFAGAGLAAFIVLAVLVGPISFYINQYLRGHTGRGSTREQPHPG